MGRIFMLRGDQKQLVFEKRTKTEDLANLQTQKIDSYQWDS